MYDGYFYIVPLNSRDNSRQVKKDLLLVAITLEYIFYDVTTQSHYMLFRNHSGSLHALPGAKQLYR